MRKPGTRDTHSMGATTSAIVLFLLLTTGLLAAPQSQVTVRTPTLAVYAQMSPTSSVVKTLKVGDVLIVGLEVMNSSGNWCSVREPGQTKALGYVSCKGLERILPTQGNEETGSTIGNPAPPPQPSAAQPSAECKQSVDDLMEAGELGQGISGLTNGLSTVDQNSGMSQKQKAEFSAMFRRAFEPKALVAGLRQSLLRRCDPALFGEVALELRTPLLKRMTALENYASTPEGLREMRSYAASIRQNPPSQRRVAILQRFEQDMQAGDFMAEVVREMGKAMLKGLGAPPGSDAEWRRATAEHLPQYRQGVILTFLFAYREVSDEDLERYVSVYEKPTFVKYSHTTQEAFIDVISQQSEVLGHLMKSSVNQTRPGARPQ